VKIPHNLDCVGCKVNENVLKQGIQEVCTLISDRVDAMDGMKACCYDSVDEADLRQKGPEEVMGLHL
jgi:hypothetical protein